MTPSHGEKISRALTGRKLSRKHKIAIKNAMTGHKTSLLTRNNISNSVKGKKHWNWKGGVTKIKNQIRNSFEYRQWRNDIIKRDNYTCQDCGRRGCKLETHHVKGLGEIMSEYEIISFEQALQCEEIWNTNNGVSLCYDCHLKLRVNYPKGFKITL